MITTSAIYWTSFLFAEHMQHIAMAISCMYVKVYVAYLDPNDCTQQYSLFTAIFILHSQYECDFPL